MTVEQYEFLDRSYRSLRQAGERGRGKKSIHLREHGLTFIAGSGVEFIMSKGEVIPAGSMVFIGRVSAESGNQRRIDDVEVNDRGEITRTGSETIDAEGLPIKNPAPDIAEMAGSLRRAMRAKRIPVPR